MVSGLHGHQRLVMLVEEAVRAWSPTLTGDHGVPSAADVISFCPWFWRCPHA